MFMIRKSKTELLEEKVRDRAQRFFKEVVAECVDDEEFSNTNFSHLMSGVAHAINREVNKYKAKVYKEKETLHWVLVKDYHTASRFLVDLLYGSKKKYTRERVLQMARDKYEQDDLYVFLCVENLLRDLNHGLFALKDKD